MKGESVNMKNVKKLLVLVLIAAVLSLGLTGCKDKSEHPTGEHPSAEGVKEAAEDAAEKAADEHPTGEHPAGKHPTGEHPQ